MRRSRYNRSSRSRRRNSSRSRRSGSKSRNRRDQSRSRHRRNGNSRRWSSRFRNVVHRCSSVAGRSLGARTSSSRHGCRRMNSQQGRIDARNFLILRSVEQVVSLLVARIVERVDFDIPSVRF